jgi:hypothetical protein
LCGFALIYIIKGPVTASLPITVLLIDPHKEDREYRTQRLNISAPEYVIQASPA